MTVIREGSLLRQIWLFDELVKSKFCNDASNKVKKEVLYRA